MICSKKKSLFDGRRRRKSVERRRELRSRKQGEEAGASANAGGD